MDGRIDLFHVGPQKSGTTWIYRCLLEHPRVACPPKDSVHYYDMFYARGAAWYRSHFREAREGQLWFDPTPSYLRSPWAPRRMAADNPDARVALCLRDPLERAFSHYWHEKKKGKYRFEFGEVLSNYDLFSAWLETGFYAEHIERLLQHFPRERVLCQRYDGMRRDPAAFLEELFRFAGVDPEFRPSVLGRRVNVAGTRRGFVHTWLLPRLNGAIKRAARRVGAPGRTDGVAALSGKSEYSRGIPADLLAPLGEICEPEIVRLEALLEIDLSSWRRWRT